MISPPSGPRIRHENARHGAVAITAAVLLLAGCAPASTADESPAPTPTSAHGTRDGAAENAEPQSTLLSVSADGDVGLFDLLTDETTELGAVGSPLALDSDGRFGFVSTPDGIDVVDSGVWSWDHGDHFHYYRADPGLPGAIPGSGKAAITTPPLSTSGATGLFFAGSGEAVAIDMAALDRGEVSEWFRLQVEADSGVVAPAGDYAIVAVDDGSGTARVYDDAGSLVEDVSAPCADPAGAITTRVGTVIGCSGGALIATADTGSVEFETVPYPSDAPRATAFAGRKNRPTVAALSGERAFWLLDTRSRSWSRADVNHELTQVAAADDADGNVVAIDASGRVRVFGPDGSDRGSTDPIASEGSTLTVDTDRAYVSAPDSGIVYEIDYADGARIARELTPATAPDVAIEVGR